MALDETSHYRAVASALVDNLLAKAIVKASQELAFTHSIASVHRKQSLETNTMSNGVTITGPPLLLPVTPKHRLAMNSAQVKKLNSVDITKRTQPSLGRTMSFCDQETPEIQIDLAGPRTPSPIEEASFELPKPELRLYKFKVADDSMCNLAENSSGDTQNSPLTPTEMKSLELRRVELKSDEVDVATTPKSEIDLVQALEISKHIVADIIHQAVEILNNQHSNNGVKCKQVQSIKREMESMSKISVNSNQMTANSSNNNCAWLGRLWASVNSAAHSLCFCLYDDKEQPKPTYV